MRKYDFIIIGAGMGGLSTANFLAMQGKSVLVLEKHDKPGGFVTSFTRKGLSFDTGLEALAELGNHDIIQQFINFWGQSVPVAAHYQNVRCFIDGKQYDIHHDTLIEDFIRYFPEKAEALKNLFAVNQKIMDEMHSGAQAPIPPYDMNFLQLITFGIQSGIHKPNLMKYGMKNFDAVIDKLVGNSTIATILFSKAMAKMVFLGYAYTWEIIRRGTTYYPLDGMQAIPDKALEALRQHGGELKLNSEVTGITFSDGKASGVVCANGEYYEAHEVISNASPHFTYKLLPEEIAKQYQPVKTIEKKKIFPSACLMFMGVKGSYDFKGSTYITITDTKAYKTEAASFTPDTCPISLIVSYKHSGQQDQSVIAMAPLPYDYKNNWNTENRKRGSAYRETKKEVQEILLNRIYKAMGQEFRDAVLFSELSTPLTMERYTYSKEGSYMGWAIDAANYGKFIRQHTKIPNLHLVGQWVFPGFGVAGVMVSGYYLAKDLLKKSDIDLEKKFGAFFEEHISK